MVAVIYNSDINKCRHRRSKNKINLRNPSYKSNLSYNNDSSVDNSKSNNSNKHPISFLVTAF